MKKLAGSVVRIVGSVYLMMLLLMVGCQSSFLYFPRTGTADALAREAAGAGLRPWRDAEGGWIGWRGDPAAPGATRALIFHGNGGCAVDRAFYAAALNSAPDGLRATTFILEYPGYGPRKGKPGEKAIHEAASQALDALLAESPEPVLLIGESLGSGVASHLAAERASSVVGMILITPMTSFVDIGKIHYPWLPVNWLLRDRYESAKALRDYDGPVVFVVAGRDEVIPARLGLALHDGYKGPKLLFVQPNSTHNTVDLNPSAPWWAEALRFCLP